MQMQLKFRHFYPIKMLHLSKTTLNQKQNYEVFINRNILTLCRRECMLRHMLRHKGVKSMFLKSQT